MQSSLIGKIEKAKYYASEPQRATLNGLSVSFRGDNDTHHVALDAGTWHCTCHYFESWGSCVHLLALQKILGAMLMTEHNLSFYQALMSDLRAMGAANVLTQRAKIPLRRDVLMRAAQIYAERFSDPDGRVRASFEIVWLSGWAPHESQQKPAQPGSATARLEDAIKGCIS